jgi:hypothetical protein
MQKQLILAALLLCSCANTKYTKDGVSADQAEAARQACMQQGEIAVASLNDDNPFDVGMRKITIADNCMKLQGYTPAGH